MQTVSFAQRMARAFGIGRGFFATREPRAAVSSSSAVTKGFAATDEFSVVATPVSRPAEDADALTQAMGKVRATARKLATKSPELAAHMTIRARTALVSGAPESPRVLGDLEARGRYVLEALAQTDGPFRQTLSYDERERRVEAIFDPALALATVVASFPARPVVAELPRVSLQGAAQKLLDAEPEAVRTERMLAFHHTERFPITPLDRWAVEGDKFVRKATREASLAEGLSFADIDTSRPMQFFRDAAARAGAPRLDLGATGRVQIFEVPPIEGVPPMEIQAVVPRAFVPGQPTVIYMSEATSAPFDATGKPLGTIGEFLGPTMNGLGDVNVILIRSPYQAEFPNGPRFTAVYDNVQASLASTTQYMDHVVQHVRDSSPGPIIMGGYSLGGAHINQYRGWFDDGSAGAGADFYIPMAAPVGGYGGLFDPATSEGKPTWWSAAQLAPEAYKQQARIARELSPAADALKRTDEKVFALIPRWDEAIQGIDDAYGDRSRRIPGGHISGAVEPFVNLTVPVLGKNVTITNWPAMGSVSRTHSSFKNAVEAFVENRPQTTTTGYLRLRAAKPDAAT